MKFAPNIITSFIDFPGHICSTIFMIGCNLSCVYCHNRELIASSDKPGLDEFDILNELIPRKGIFPAVNITGGEPTLQSGLVDFVLKLKLYGFAVKIDTNGYNPETIKELLDHKCLDYIAMDIKSGLDATHHPHLGDHYSSVNRVKDIRQSAYLISHSGIPYEFRTTVFPDVTPISEIRKICKDILQISESSQSEKKVKYCLQKGNEVPMTKKLGFLPPDEAFMKQAEAVFKEYPQLIDVVVR